MLELLTAAATVVGLDQASKAIAVRTLAAGRVVPSWTGAPARLRLVANPRPGLWLPRDHRARLGPC